MTAIWARTVARLKPRTPGLCENGEIVFGRGVGCLGSRAEGLELLMTIRAADDLGNQPWELSNGHVFGRP